MRYLMHHGIKGQHWGVKNGPPYPLDDNRSLAIKNLQNAKTSNLRKWGKSQKTNVLYIAGYSGSGKSTTAIGLANENDHVIHLDMYTESLSPSEHKKWQDATFNKYLDKHVPNWRDIGQSEDGGQSAIARSSKEYWEIVDRFADAIEQFAGSEYTKGNRVIVEGVQIADNWLHGDSSWYKGKPLIILKTNPVRSMHQAFERDSRGKNIFEGLMSLDSSERIGYIKWYFDTNKKLNTLSDTAGAVDSPITQDILRQYRNVYLSSIK